MITIYNDNNILDGTCIIIKQENEIIIQILSEQTKQVVIDLIKNILSKLIVKNISFILKFDELVIDNKILLHYLNRKLPIFSGCNNSDFQNIKYNTASLDLYAFHSNISFNHIISLGLDCAPRIFLTKHGFKKTKKQGELTSPFDLAIHKVQSIIDLLKNKFQDYYNPKYLYIDDSSLHSKIVNSKYDAEFVHESDYLNDNKEYNFNTHQFIQQNINYSENDYEKLADRYKKRVQNFYKNVNDNNIIFTLFVYSIDNVFKLNDVIHDTFPTLSYILVVFIQTNNEHISDLCVSNVIIKTVRSDEIWHTNSIILENSIQYIFNILTKTGQLPI